jgi:hypothetical protein
MSLAYQGFSFIQEVFYTWAQAFDLLHVLSKGRCRRDGR